MCHYSYKESKRIRESYKILPFQGIWTWITGKELYGRTQLWKTTSVEVLIWSLIWTIMGIFLTNYSINNIYSINYIALVIGSILSASGARYIVATVIHQSVHGNLLFGKKDEYLTEILSFLLIVEPYKSYKNVHVTEHHGKEFGTLLDKDLSAIYSLGFTPGKTIKKLYLNLLVQLFNPIFHYLFFKNRLKANILNDSIKRSILTIIYITFLMYISINNGILWSIVVIIFPFIILYQISSLLHLITEHSWILRKDNESVKDSHYKNSLGRFCGSTCPNEYSFSTIKDWTKWFIIQLIYHLPTRLLILQGSLTCHDWHHRFGKNNNWMDFSSSRESYANELYESNKFDLIETWGYLSSLNYVFNTISRSEKVNLRNLEFRLN